MVNSNMTPALIIIYNHRFDQNIPKLNEIYKNKFSKIYHLVPFYDGNLSNVIPVFENSFYFQGYIPQAKHILKNIDCTHYLCIGDDLILHPDFNENNVLEKLTIGKGEGFLPWYWGMLSDISLEWANTFPSINAFYAEDYLLHHAPDWKKVLPERESAIKVFEKYNFKTGKLLFNSLKGENGTYDYPRFDITRKEYLKLLFKKRRTLPYPLLAAYSDIFVIAKQNLKNFSKYCELFRQMRLWVEVALPTAMLLSHENVKFEKDSKWQGTTYWINKNLEEMTERYNKVNFNFELFMKSYKEKELYIHPVKLSQWEINI